MKLVISLHRLNGNWTLHLNKSGSPPHRQSVTKTFLPSLSPSLHVSYSVWTGGSLGTSVGQLSGEGGGCSVTTNQLFPPGESSSLSCLNSAAHSRFLDLQHATPLLYSKLHLLQRYYIVRTRCCCNTIKPQRCSLSSLWGVLMPEGAMFSGHLLSGQSNNFSLATSPGTRHRKDLDL